VLYSATSTPSYFSSPILLGAFGLLLGAGAIAAALRRRRGRDRYPETYAASGGIIYTVVQIGCGGILLLGSAGLVALSLVNRG
jgi:hypothetical protein